MEREGASRPARAEREAEALRRRLYAPDASPEDVDRYRAVVPPPAPSAPSEPAPGPEVPSAAGPVAEAPPPVRRRRPGRRDVLAVGLTALVVAAGVAAVRLTAPEPPLDVPAPSPLASDDIDRTAFEENLALGNQAGISAYLVTHGSPSGLRGATRFDTIERTGAGPAVLDLTPVPAAALRGGRATVLLVLAGTARADWVTQRRELDSGGEQRYVRQTRRGGVQAAGVLTSTTFRYRAGERPVRLRIDVPDGARWGAAVVFSD